MSNIYTLLRTRKHVNSLPFLKIDNNTATYDNSTYIFDKIFVNETNYDIFNYINKYTNDANIRNCKDNGDIRNNLVFICYGSTATGKTYTLFGNSKDKGVYQHIIDTYNVIQCKCYELYNNKMVLRSTDIVKIGDGVVVRRKTDINERSSRSHTIVEMLVNSKNKDNGKSATDTSKSTEISPNKDMVGTDTLPGSNKIIIIDLAGAEDNRKTGNNTVALKESSHINTSLFVLRKVIYSIYHKNINIPYRESTLTRYLQTYLTGTVMIMVHVWDDYEMAIESMCSIKFGNVLGKIKVDESINNDKKNSVDDSKYKCYERLFNNSKDRDTITRNMDVNNSKHTNIINRYRNDVVKHNNGKCADDIGRYRNDVVKHNDGKCADDIDKNSKRVLRDIINGNRQPIRNSSSVDTTTKCTSNRGTARHINGRTLIRRIGTKSLITKKELISVVNRCDIVRLKRIRHIGDKRAMMIIEYVKYKRMTDVEELRKIFSKKVYENIMKSVI